MRTAVIFVVAIILAAGCKRRDKIPPDIIPPDKMEKVLWDLIRADEYVSGYIINNDSTKNKKAESLALYEKVFHIHAISGEEFQKSFSFYRSKPGLLRMVTDSLYKSSQATTSQENQTRYSPDSINKRLEIKTQ